MVEAVLFDLDGVLVDSEPISRVASDQVLSKHGIVQTPEERRKVFGRRTVDNYRDAIEARGLDLDPGKLMAEKNKLFADMIKGKLKPLPGVLELLAALKDAGKRVAVVSSSPLERVNASLGEVGLLLEFELIVSGDCCDKGKPDPQPFLLAAKRLGAAPGECVIIEDAEAGILSGKAAGMKVVAVRSPNTHGQDLGSADLIVDSMRDINVRVLEEL